MRQKDDFDSLEQWTDRRLGSLPLPVAPADFSRRVMDAVHREGKTLAAIHPPSKALPWIRWVLASMSATLLLLLWTPVADRLLAVWQASESGQFFQGLQRLASACHLALESVMAQVPDAVWPVLLIAVGLAYALTFTLGSAIYRLTLSAPRSLS